MIEDCETENATGDTIVAEWVDEIMTRLRDGQAVDLSAYEGSDPGRVDHLRRLLPVIAMLAELSRSHSIGSLGASRESLASTVPEGEAPPRRLGDFQILREIGRGGMGLVYEAEQCSLRRRVALKVLPTIASIDPRQLARFRIEAQAAAQLHHAHIVPVFAVGEAQGVHYFAMQLIAGRSLHELIAELRREAPPAGSGTPTLPAIRASSPLASGGSSGALSTTAVGTSGTHARAAAALGLQAAEALEYAHQQGVIHRDIKPANLMVDDRGHVWVTDFGLARLQSEAGLTMTGDLLGTARYMSPEQALGLRGAVDHRTDVYGLGLTLYELLALRPAFDDGDRRALIRRILEEEPRPLRQVNPAVPRDLETIVRTAMAREVADRYPTAGALAEDLRRFLDGRPILASRPSTVDHALKWARRRWRAVAAGMAILSLFIILVIGGLWWSNARLRSYVDQLKAERDRADRESALAERRRVLSDRHLHAALLREVRQALDAGQWERAQDLLDAIRPTDPGEDPRGFAWHYLRMRARREVVRLRPQSSVLWGLAQAADGGRIAYATETREIIVHDPAADRIVARLGGNTIIPSNLDFSPDGRWLVSGGSTQHGLRSEVRLWNLATETPLADLDEFDSAWVHGVRFVGRGRILEVLAVPSGSIHAFHWYFDLAPDPARPVLLYRLPHHWSTAATPDGEVIHLLEPGVFGRLDLIRGETTGSYPFVHEAFRSFAVSPDGHSLVYLTTQDGGQIVILDLDTGDERGRLPLDGSWFTEQGEPRAILVSARAEVVVLVRKSGSALVWDRRAGTVQRIEPPGSDRPEAGAHVDLSADGRLLALSTWGIPGGQLPIVLYEVTTGAPAATYPGQPERYRNIKFAADGESLLISSRESIKRWRFDRSGDEPPTLGHDAEAWAVAFSPDGRVLATGSDDVGESRTIRLWDAATGSPRKAWTGGPGMVSALAFSPDGRSIASAVLTPSDNLWLWEAATGEAIGSFVGHTDRVRGVAFAPDGSLLASCGSDRTIRLWNPVTRREVGGLLGHTDTVRQIAFSPDGKTLASASNDSTVRLWDVAARRPGPVVHGPGPFTAVAFSPAGDQLAAADQNGAITLIDPNTGHEIGRILSEVSELRALAYAPNGRAMAAAGMGTVIRLWDTLTGQELLTLEGHAAQINALAFSPDGRTLASCGHDGEVRLWSSTERK